MPQTNLQVVTEGFQKAGIVDENESPSALQGTNGLTLLNDFLLFQARDGLRLGWFPQTNLAATAPLKDEDIWGVKILLAGQLCISYGISLASKPDLVAEIERATSMLAKRSLQYFEADFSEWSRPQGGPWGGPNWI